MPYRIGKDINTIKTVNAIIDTVTVSGTVSISGDVNIGTMPDVHFDNATIGIAGDVNIGTMPNVTFTNTTIGISGDVNVTGSVTVSGDVNITNETLTITGKVEITNASITVTGSVTVSGSVSITGDVHFDNTTIAVTGAVTVSGDVNIGTMPNVTFTNTTIGISGDVNVTGTVAVSGTVTISGTVTFTNTTISVTGSTINISGTVAIATAGGTNIIIDKLVQTAYTERRSTISNDNGVTSPTAPPQDLTGYEYRGKYFPRGMRGFIRGLQIYCKRTGSGTLKLAYAPQPSMGKIGSVTITPAATWDWKDADVKRFWNYDSLFIWIESCDADVSIGFDTAEPADGWTSSDNGVTWGTQPWRYFISVRMDAETVGDIPVSGTINNIEIPMVQGAFKHYEANLLAGTTVGVLGTIYGTGTLNALQLKFLTIGGSVPKTKLVVGIVVDGTTFEETIADLAEDVDNIINSVSPYSFQKIDDTFEAERYALAVNTKICFRRSLRIYVKNTANTGNHSSIGAFYGYELQK